MRDMEKQPYSKDELRVAEFFYERGTGGGPDPIGALIASHEMLIAERRAQKNTVTFELREKVIKVEERFQRRYDRSKIGTAKTEAQMTFEEYSIGWWVVLERFGASIHFPTKPEIEPGDELVLVAHMVKKS